jgi:hypothetical protein
LDLGSWRAIRKLDQGMPEAFTFSNVPNRVLENHWLEISQWR